MPKAPILLTDEIPAPSALMRLVIETLPATIGARNERTRLRFIHFLPRRSQPRIQRSHQEQAAVRSDVRTLEVDLQPSIERELKRLFLGLTHRCSTSAPLQSHPPASIRAFKAFYPICSPLGKRKSGLSGIEEGDAA